MELRYAHGHGKEMAIRGGLQLANDQPEMLLAQKEDGQLDKSQPQEEMAHDRWLTTTHRPDEHKRNFPGKHRSKLLVGV